MQQNYETKYINGECSVAIQIVGVCRFLLANLLFSVEYLAKKKKQTFDHERAGVVSPWVQRLIGK